MLSDLEADKYGLSMAPWPWVSSWLVQWGAPAADQIQGKVNLKIHSPFPWAPILCRVTVGWICPLSEATAPAQWPSPHSVFLGLSNCILYSFLESYVRKWFLVAVTNPDTLWCFVVSLHPFIILFSNAPISLFFLFFFFWWCLRKHLQYGWQHSNGLELTSSNTVSFLFCRCWDGGEDLPKVRQMVSDGAGVWTQAVYL